MLKMKFPVLPDLSFYVLTPTTAAQCELHNVSVWKAYKSQKRVEITDKKKTLSPVVRVFLCVCVSRLIWQLCCCWGNGKSTNYNGNMCITKEAPMQNTFTPRQAPLPTPPHLDTHPPLLLCYCMYSFPLNSAPVLSPVTPLLPDFDCK